ncbi:hypothetical protein EOD39_3683 [Acipenser ruthenus]|uniref:Uncharacterized protein n=1 Tax=Acipenser ruthenus TaxID=7906 RepID=A0A444ULQ4_ACIRT|nr:hypothetical protein EOD39_3683 [Acipenser ruthenus]
MVSTKEPSQELRISVVKLRKEGNPVRSKTEVLQFAKTYSAMCGPMSPGPTDRTCYATTDPGNRTRGWSFDRHQLLFDFQQ